MGCTASYESRRGWRVTRRADCEQTGGPMFYTQLCHTRRHVSAVLDCAKNLLKKIRRAEIQVEFRNRSALQRQSPLIFAQPVWQISGEVVIRLRGSFLAAARAWIANPADPELSAAAQCGLDRQPAACWPQPA